MSEPLPIDPLLPQIAATVAASSGAVLLAPPGAGKTTRVPRALWEAGLALRGEIVVLEPRRLAARLAAARVAAEIGERLGESIGYSVRFESLSSARTKVRFVTEGVLARRLLADPRLSGVAAVVLDEFHERHLTTDLALGFARRLQLGARPDLKVVVMSATLDPTPIAAHLGGVPILRSEGARFDIAIEYEEKPDARPLDEKVASAVRRLAGAGIDGDVLVFLPGAREIRRALAALEPVAAHYALDVCALHGDLPAAEQARALEPAPEGRRKVVLATNVAESSVTIPRIAAVVDSGLARIAGSSPWSGLPTLQTSRTSKASAIQRAGRAGRTRAGRVVRLYTRFDFDSRPERDKPEIERADLTETLLLLRGAGVADVRAFPWLDPPPQAALDAAESLLRRLGAVDPRGELTATGGRMLRFPVHPRLARLIVEAEARGAGRAACAAAAMLSERDLRLETRESFAPRSKRRAAGATAASDLFELLDRMRQAADRRALERLARAERQLASGLESARSELDAETEAEALRIAALAAFPDRVAKRRARGARLFTLSGGGAAELDEASVVADAELVVALEAEHRSEAGLRRGAGEAVVSIRLASAIEPEWLAALAPDEISGRRELVWNEEAGRVDEVERSTYGRITLEEKIRSAPRSEETSRVLCQAALARKRTDLEHAGGIDTLRARLELAAAHFPDAGFTPLGDAELQQAVAAACAGKRSLAELEGIELDAIVLARLQPAARELLRRELPERITLQGGRAVRVHYTPGTPPWIESRLQDFFGMERTPSICRGRLPLTLHLLAPNGRAVQVTQDLAGFWERHYPAIRRELARRYPRHAWPESGRTAAPPRPR